jgi:hypothetical protein
LCEQLPVRDYLDASGSLSGRNSRYSLDLSTMEVAGIRLTCDKAGDFTLPTSMECEAARKTATPASLLGRGIALNEAAEIIAEGSL